MKKLLRKGVAVFSLCMVSLCSVLAETSVNGPSSNSIQDTQKAAQYFEDEMNFKTNTHFINRAIKEKMDNITIVDVRSEDDFTKGHIPGAINIPFGKFSNFEGSETEFPGLRKDGFNCIYCYTATCNLAQKAAKKFASLGYPVKEIVGGYESWVEHKHPVEAGSAK